MKKGLIIGIVAAVIVVGIVVVIIVKKKKNTATIPPTSPDISSESPEKLLDETIKDTQNTYKEALTNPVLPTKQEQISTPIAPVYHGKDVPNKLKFGERIPGKSL